MWAKPLDKVAAELGISSYTLLKFCNEHEVSRPGTGYWQSIRAGLLQQVSPLKARPDGYPDIIDISSSSPHDASELKKLAKLPKRLHVLLTQEQPGGRRQQYNPVIQRAREKSTNDPQKQILSRIFHAVEALGGTVNGSLDRASADFGGQRVDFRVVERLKTVKLPVSKFDINFGTTAGVRGWRNGYAPTGILVCEIETDLRGSCQQRWVETKASPLEHAVPSIAMSLERGAAAERARVEEDRLRRQRIEARRLADAKQRVELERDQKQWEQFGGFAEAWRQGATIRDFITELKRSDYDADMIVGGRSIAEWLDWAELHLEVTDPLSAGVAGLFTRVVRSVDKG